MPANKVLCFGEPLLRMSPRLNGEWIERNIIPTYIGGAELNVATALAIWNIPAKYCTAVPDNAISKDLIDYLKKKNIDASAVQISGSRLGIYFLPQGSDLKNSGVIYDRASSSFSELRPGMMNWDEVLNNVSWLHLSAISPALNNNVADLCEELVKVASQKNITVSLDLNYRSKLWKYGKRPAEVMSRIVSYCDVVMGNIWAAEDLLDIPVDNNALGDRDSDACIAHAKDTSMEIMKAYPKVRSVANTFRFDRSENGILYFATIYQEGSIHVSQEINAFNIKDKIGSGDCFMAGLIYGNYNGWMPDHIVNFAATAAVGKMYEISDATSQNLDKVMANTTNTWTNYE